MKTVLFDLDGTLVNSERGITKCAQYALQAFGVDVSDLSSLRFFIGPPLVDSFMEHYGFDREQALEAIVKYRERYHSVGIFECELYPGVREVLEQLKSEGYQIAMASSKPESSCITILKHFEIDSYFDEVTGATMDGSRDSKIQVLQEVITRLDVSDMSDMILVGDTKFDAIGAKEAGMKCLGVSYGFGSRDELLENGAVAVCGSMKEVGDYIEEHF